MPNAAARELLPPSSPSARNSRPGDNPLLRLSEISRIVNQVVASWHSPLAVAEQRRWQRIHYERPAVLTPWDEDANRPAGVHKIVSGRDISPNGFSFTHLDPLPCRARLCLLPSRKILGTRSSCD